jgi:hypothetical protein
VGGRPSSPRLPACSSWADTSHTLRQDAQPSPAPASSLHVSFRAAGREHLLFYARIKNMNGRQLRRAVDDALRSVNLFSVGDDLVGGYRWVRVGG